MKTIRDYFSALPYPININALNNYSNTGFGYCGSLKIALTLAFDWNKSYEGFEYWNDIYNGRTYKYVKEKPLIKRKKSYHIKAVPKKRKAKRIIKKYNKPTISQPINSHSKFETFNNIDDAIESILKNGIKKALKPPI